MNVRVQKILLGIVIAGYMLLVCFNNIADYNSNFVFLSKVSSMGDLFSGDVNRWRSVQQTWLHHAMYLFVIGFEITITWYLCKGVFSMLKTLNYSDLEFAKAKNILLTGLTLGALLWMGMFIGIAGEWFLMWQSKTWNAQSTAFSLSIVFLLIRLNIVSKED